MKQRGLDRNLLKAVAAFFMVLDSAYLRFPLPSWLHLVTRFVAPLFAWLMVDGFFHTRDRAAYGKRLWLAALLMQAFNCLSYALFAGKIHGIDDNIFLTLALGFQMLTLLEASKQAEKGRRFLLRLGAGLLLLAGITLSFVRIPLLAGSGLMVEGGLELMPLILIAWLFRDKRGLQALVYGAWCLLLGVLLYGFPLCLADFDMFCVNSDWVTLLVIPFFFLYRGRMGRKSRFGRSFFYVFYPLHLWLLTLLQYLTR